MSQHATLIYNHNINSMSNSSSSNAFHLPQHHHHLNNEKDRRVLQLNNRACVLVLAKDDYSEANKLFDTALMMHKEHTEETSASSLIANHHYQTTASALPLANHSHSDPHCGHNNNNNNNININNEINELESLDSSCHSDDLDFSEEDYSEFEDDFGDMDWDGKDDHEPTHYHASMDSQLQQQQSWSNNNTNHQCRSNTKIPRMTTGSQLRALPYCGQEEYQAELNNNNFHTDHHHHQVYSLPIVMDEMEWETAPVQDKSFVLIFNTALCNHLWGMQLMQQYIAATNSTTMDASAINALAQHCRETLTVSKLLYKLALENSVSFANGVDKMCYVALYNNLSHVLKTLEGYESVEARWCDDMLVKAIFWWRDSTNQTSRNTNSNSNHQSSQQPPATEGAATTATSSSSSNNNNNNYHQSSNDQYLDDDCEIIDGFLDNVFYRIGVSEDMVPAAAA